jgi:hypothetical protein
MLDIVKEEMRQVREAIDDMWLDLTYDLDYLENLQSLYTLAESLVDGGHLEAAQYWLGHFWIKLGDSQ